MNTKPKAINRKVYSLNTPSPNPLGDLGSLNPSNTLNETKPSTPTALQTINPSTDPSLKPPLYNDPHPKPSKHPPGKPSKIMKSYSYLANS